MSAVLQDRVIIDRRPQARPQAQPKTKARVRQRRKAITWRELLRFSAWVSAGALSLHFVGGFTAQLLIEQSRRAAIRAETLAVKAEQESAALRIQLDLQQSSDKIESWATMNGFRPSYLAVHDAASN